MNSLDSVKRDYNNFPIGSIAIAFSSKKAETSSTNSLSSRSGTQEA